MKSQVRHLAIVILFCCAPSALFADFFEGLPLHGFLDVGGGVGSSSQPVFNKAQGFRTGTLDLFLTPAYGNVQGLTEIVIEPDRVGQVNGLDIERIQLGYFFGDYGTLWVGRFHTPYGFWHTAYHHGAYLQPTIERPRFMNFEDSGGVLPAHTVGALFTGRVKSGPGRFIYSFWAGNGQRIIPYTVSNSLPGIGDFNLLWDDNSDVALGANVAYKLFDSFLKGSRVGVFGLKQRVNGYDGVSNTPLNQSDMRLIGAFFVYDNEDSPFEANVEYYHFVNTNVGGSAKTSEAGFAYLAYSVTPWLKFFGKWEKATFNQGDVYFTDQYGGMSYDRASFGSRVELNERTAIKAEVSNTNQSAFSGYGGNVSPLASPTTDNGATSYVTFRMQGAFRF